MYSKGTIVLVPFPFTDLSGVKVRPAVVLASHKKSADMIVVFITSTKHQGLFSVSIKPSTKNGIKVPSTIVCDKIATLDKKIIVGKIGECEPVILDAVNGKLKNIFGL